MSLGHRRKSSGERIHAKQHGSYMLMDPLPIMSPRRSFLVTLEGNELEYAIKFGFKATNNGRVMHHLPVEHGRAKRF